MNSQDRRPAWWELYLLVPLMVLLLEVENRAPLSELGHAVAVFGVLALVCGLVAVWVQINKPALMCANDLAALLKDSHAPVVRERAGRERSQPCPVQAAPSKTATRGKGNGERDLGQVVEPVSESSDEKRE